MSYSALCLVIVTYLRMCLNLKKKIYIYIMTEFPKSGSLEALKIQFTFCLMESFWDCIQSSVLKHCLLKCHKFNFEKQWIAYYSLVNCLSSNYHL